VGWHSRVIGTSSHLSKNCRLIRFLGLDELTYSGGQNKVGQVLLRNLAKIELSKPGLL
jgi:hypothetical protein